MEDYMERENLRKEQEMNEYRERRERERKERLEAFKKEMEKKKQ
ncbi:MAG: hypothetical protein ACRDDH_00040 [Cetobacterium sp.]